MLRWAILADVVVVTHFLYVVFVAGGCVAILLGVMRGWQWTRGITFRALHLMAIAFVFGESVSGIECPLTVLENNLRERAGQTQYAGACVGFWAHRLIFYDAPSWVFTTLYGAITLALIAGLWLAPPRITRT